MNLEEGGQFPKPWVEQVVDSEGEKPIDYFLFYLALGLSGKEHGMSW